VLIIADNKKLVSKLKKRNNYNPKIFKILKSLQIPVNKKMEKADFVVKNNFNSVKMKKEAKNLLNKIII